MKSRIKYNILFVLVYYLRLHKNVRVCWNGFQVTHQDFMGHPKPTKMANDRPLRYLFKEQSNDPAVNQPVNATQMVRNSTPCIASLLCQLEAEIQTLRIFSGAAKAIASPIIWDFVLIQLYHFHLGHLTSNPLEKEQFFLEGLKSAPSGNSFSYDTPEG